MCSSDLAGMNINYTGLPESVRGCLKRYIEDKIQPGGFVTAVLSNDLFGAFGAADHINRPLVGDIVAWIYNNAPMGCWGSRKRVREWLQG